MLENPSSDPSERLTYEIIGSAIEVHRLLGPGLLESTYEQCLVYELSQKGFGLKVQAQLPLEYKGIKLERAYRVDLIVENKVIIEIKATEHVQKIHYAQLLTYMKLTNVPIGLIINFNSVPLKDGISRHRL